MAAAASILAGSLAAWGYLAGHWRLNYPSREEFSIQGIDVSHHQGNIDWRKVAKDGHRFAYIKATEGGDFKDPDFQRNWAAARKNGLKVGAYHFFTFCKPGRIQALNFVESVPDDDGSLPPAIDFEFAGNCRERPSKETVLRELTDFTDILVKKYRRHPVLYVTRASYSRYLAGRTDRRRLWMRDVFRRPGRIDERAWTIWQYADNIRVNGIDGPVDQNAFNGGEEDFTALLETRPAAANTAR
jgi:lysozyme